jgi:hypothetical protein
VGWSARDDDAHSSVRGCEGDYRGIPGMYMRFWTGLSARQSAATHARQQAQLHTREHRGDDTVHDEARGLPGVVHGGLLPLQRGRVVEALAQRREIGRQRDPDRIHRRSIRGLRARERLDLCTIHQQGVGVLEHEIERVGHVALVALLAVERGEAHACMSRASRLQPLVQLLHRHGPAEGHGHLHRHPERRAPEHARGLRTSEARVDRVLESAGARVEPAHGVEQRVGKRDGAPSAETRAAMHELVEPRERVAKLSAISLTRSACGRRCLTITCAFSVTDQGVSQLLGPAARPSCERRQRPRAPSLDVNSSRMPVASAGSALVAGSMITARSFARPSPFTCGLPLETGDERDVVRGTRARDRRRRDGACTKRIASTRHAAESGATPTRCSSRGSAVVRDESALDRRSAARRRCRRSCSPR